MGEGCTVCGDKVNGSRYGVPACLGCIVFFRRAITKDAKYKCVKGRNCEITFESRCICRSCRLDKCLRVGMKPEAIQRRDVMGPRKPKQQHPNSPKECPSVASSSGTSCDSWCGADSLMEKMVKLQIQLRERHKTLFAVNDPTVELNENIFTNVQDRLSSGMRRARKQDVNGMLRCGIMDATEWGKSFKEFRGLSLQEKKMLLQDFGFAMAIIDQGYLTSQQPDKDLWIIQNGTYMCADYTRGLHPEELSSVDPHKAKMHPLFVQEAIDLVGNPMRVLQIDAYECAALKTLMLLSYRNIFPEEQRESGSLLKSRLATELMDYCNSKDRETAAERFGAIMLMTTNIRCSVYFTYTHTRVSDVFGLMTFDPLVRDVLLT